MRLSFRHDITEKRKNGIINQTMIVSAEYDHEDDSITDIEVHIMQNGKSLLEISKLLDKAEGDPLSAIVDAINWEELYLNQREEVAA